MVDTLKPAHTGLEKASKTTMPKHTYTDEFKVDAVALYESRGDLSYAQAAQDLGVSRAALKTWVRKARESAATPESIPAMPENEADRLRSENTALRAKNRLLEEERDILRKATKYFAAETNW